MTPLPPPPRRTRPPRNPTQPWRDKRPYTKTTLTQKLLLTTAFAVLKRNVIRHLLSSAETKRVQRLRGGRPVIHLFCHLLDFNRKERFFKHGARESCLEKRRNRMTAYETEPGLFKSFSRPESRMKRPESHLTLAGKANEKSRKSPPEKEFKQQSI